MTVPRCLTTLSGGAALRDLRVRNAPASERDT